MIWKKKRLQVTCPEETDPDSHFAIASIPGSISMAVIIIAIALAVEFLWIIGRFEFEKRGLQSS
ncbi:MAG: hypothetical protein OES20_10690 [Gammaproteobacteria bacterium]|nr:hypothetical protein [Gammaproteobacteria bacterium]